MQVKVCGISNETDLFSSVAAGADLLGFVCDGPGALSIDEAARLVELCPETITPVLVTDSSEPGEIISTAVQIGAPTIQLRGEMTASQLRELNAVRGNRKLIREISSNSPNAFETVARQAPHCQIILLNSDAQEGPKGRANWDLSNLIASGLRVSGKSAFLGGNLNPDNLAEALRRVQPLGIDVREGVEDESGNKDPDLLREIVFTARMEG